MVWLLGRVRVSYDTGGLVIVVRKAGSNWWHVKDTCWLCICPELHVTPGNGSALFSSSCFGQEFVVVYTWIWTGRCNDVCIVWYSFMHWAGSKFELESFECSLLSSCTAAVCLEIPDLPQARGSCEPARCLSMHIWGIPLEATLAPDEARGSCAEQQNSDSSS